MGKQSRRKRRVREAGAPDDPRTNRVLLGAQVLFVPDLPDAERARLFASLALSPRQQFQAAALATEMEDRLVAGCLLCGAAAVGVGYWLPAPPYARYFGVPEGKLRPLCYALCEACLEREQAGRGARVEEKFLAEHRCRVAAREAGLEIVPEEDGGPIAIFPPDEPTLDRFRAAYERHAPPEDS